MRTLIQQDPFIHLNTGKSWRERGLWPCSWIAPAASITPPLVAAYRLRFSLAAAADIRAHVSADERYELFLDGVRIGRGPERGDPYNWFYETYDLRLAAGDHTLAARVWSLGETGAEAQMSVQHGFLFAPEGGWTARLGTGLAGWETQVLTGYSFGDKFPAPWRAAALTLDGRQYPWGVEQGNGDGWEPAHTLKRAMGRWLNWELLREHRLQPAPLPPMLDQPFPGSTVRFVSAADSADLRAVPVRTADHLTDEAQDWSAFQNNQKAITIPAQTTRRVLIDLDTYICAYPELVTSGGEDAVVRIEWAESLYHNSNVFEPIKGNRNDIEGKFFIGRGDTFILDGGTDRVFMPLWWQAGRYVQLVIQTKEQPLILHRLTLHETRYPLEMESRFESDDSRLEQLTPLLVRALQVTANETYFDSPYYEEMMYTADTRLECLITHVMTRDDRLPRKALRLYDSSRLANGFTQSRYPTRVPQVIPAFALWWTSMAHDFAMWRDPELVKTFLPGLRATLAAFERHIGSDGLLHAPEGWNTLDWVPNWEAGIPPDGVDGVSGLLNWQLIYALNLAADLEQRLGSPDIAAWLRRWMRNLAERAADTFWDEERGLLADDLSRQHFSEHTQCLALLSGQLEPTRAARAADSLLAAPDLARASIYFSHYLFETLRQIGRADRLFERLDQLWFTLVENGLRTTIESPEPSRSDCHAWSAHPLYHYFATILGIRPSSPGFRTVEVWPQLGHLRRAAGTLVHPDGEITVELMREHETLRGSIRLPAGINGILIANGETITLEGGWMISF